MTSPRDLEIQRLFTSGLTPWQIAVLWHLPVLQVRLALHRMQCVAPIIEAPPARVVRRPADVQVSPWARVNRLTLDMAEVLREAQPRAYARSTRQVASQQLPDNL